MFTVEAPDGRKVACTELNRQPYLNAVISAGAIDGYDPDEIYLKFDREGEEELTIFLRKDEVAAILHCLSGTLWSILECEMREGK